MRLGFLFVASEKRCLTLGNVEQNYQIFAKIYSQIYLCKYFDALPLSHAFYQGVKGFFSQVMQGALGLRPCCPAAQMSWKYPPNTHEYPP